MLQIVGEASFHAPFGYCVADYLEQAWVAVDFVELDKLVLTAMATSAAWNQTTSNRGTSNRAMAEDG